jgi:hypothetical protein
MSTRRKRLLLFGYLIAALLVLLGVGYRAFLDVPVDRTASEQAVVVKDGRAADRLEAAPPNDTAQILKRARTILHPIGPVDSTEPILEQQYRDLHEPLYNMNPRDK